MGNEMWRQFELDGLCLRNFWCKKVVTMSWPKALLTWLLIAIAESIHGTLRQLIATHILGDLPARQLGVLGRGASRLHRRWLLNSQT